MQNATWINLDIMLSEISHRQICRLHFYKVVKTRGRMVAVGAIGEDDVDFKRHRVSV